MTTSTGTDRANTFYIFDLVKKLRKEKNIASLIYLILNVVLVCGIFYFLGSGQIISIFAGIAVYALSAFLSLSPFGEWILRLTHGCKELKSYDPAIYERCIPLFEEVKARAKQFHPDHIIDEKITLYIKEDPDVNAFAVGRRTICMSTGLLACSDDEIKAVLGHEFGHLATHDTDLKLLILVGNFIISAFVTIVQFAIIIMRFLASIAFSLVGQDGIVADFFAAVFSTVSLVCINLVMWLWAQVGILLMMKTSREAEYVADLFSCEMGYYEGLRSVFQGFLSKEYTVISGGFKERLDVFATLAASHPATEKRIARLDEYMNQGQNAALVAVTEE